MQVIYDNLFYYSPRSDTKAACHLKVLIGNIVVLTIVTEIQENLGWSIARSPEILTTQVINMFQLNPEITRYIEHYPPQEKKDAPGEGALVKSIEAYFLVDFTWDSSNDVFPLYKAEQPQRKALSVIEFVRLMRTLYTQ